MTFKNDFYNNINPQIPGGKHLAKYVYDLYTENSKVLLKKMKEYLNIPCSQIGGLIIVTLSILSTFIYRFRKNLFNILPFLCEN